MSARQIFGNLFKLAILGACIYAVMKWQGSNSQGGGLEGFAESSCIDAIGNRYELSNLRAYDVTDTATGYTVRVSATAASGARVRVVCLTTAQGGVRDIVIDER